MDYLSTSDTAKRWGCSVRNVQRLLNCGRIPNAKKYGTAWMIPFDAEKPDDPRKCKSAEKENTFFTMSLKCPLLTLTPLYNEPGRAYDVEKELSYDAEVRLLFKAQINYLQGNIDKANSLLDGLSEDKTRQDVFIGAELTRCLCALYNGDTDAWLKAYGKLKNTNCQSSREKDFIDFFIGIIDLSLYDHKKCPEWFADGDFEHLPFDCYATARYTYIKYLMLSTEKPAVFIFLKPFIAQCKAENAFVAEIYCRILIAVAYHESGQLSLATEQIDRAIELSLPDRLYAPLAEYRNDLGTLLDERLIVADAKAAKEVRALSRRLIGGWSKLNKELRGVIYTTELTVQEHHIAKLAAKGLTNAEIAKQMSLTVNTVKHHISNAISKTGAANRSELSRFIAMGKTE